MRRLYSFLYTCGMLVALPYFLVVGLFRGKYLRSAWQRLGSIPQRSDHPSCWIHCVSVGEFLAAKPLIRKLQSEWPRLPVFISTTTLTGQALARALYPDATFYFPFDWAWCLRRVFRRIRPGLVLVMETELWPNFLWECERQGVPALLINGRISERSFRRYSRVRAWLPRFRELLMQTETDAERMRMLGADPEHVRIMGNLKFEFTPPPLSAELRRILTEWKGQDRLWIAGSTMPGEEELLLKTLKDIQPGVRLLLAPRHPERFEEAALLASRLGFTVSRRSLTPAAGSEVMILDSMGELASCYELADVVFVGGTLKDFGGHNPIEPAYFGKPIVVGPFDSNFRSIFDEFRKRQAVCVTSDITAAVRALLQDSAKAREMGNAARSLVLQGSGAVEASMDAIAPHVTRILDLAPAGAGSQS